MPHEAGPGTIAFCRPRGRAVALFVDELLECFETRPETPKAGPVEWALPSGRRNLEWCFQVPARLEAQRASLNCPPGSAGPYSCSPSCGTGVSVVSDRGRSVPAPLRRPCRSAKPPQWVVGLRNDRIARSIVRGAGTTQGRVNRRTSPRMAKGIVFTG